MFLWCRVVGISPVTSKNIFISLNIFEMTNLWFIVSLLTRVWSLKNSKTKSDLESANDSVVSWISIFVRKTEIARHKIVENYKLYRGIVCCWTRVWCHFWKTGFLCLYSVLVGKDNTTKILFSSKRSGGRNNGTFLWIWLLTTWSSNGWYQNP